MILFIWDFHGVLEKGNENAVIEISNQVLKDSGFNERFTKKDNERFYGLKWYQYFEKLLPNLTKEKCIELQAACFRYAENDLGILAKHIKPNNHVIEVLSKISKSGSQQIVVSNTRQNDLIWFLGAIGVNDFFKQDEIIGVNAHQNHNSKLDAVKYFLKYKNFEKIVVVGDFESDLAFGREIGAINYFYKHPHRKHEPTQKADHITNDLRDVLKELD
jgi:phosphoglycolate phosphatase-like HAD superfamily hydrolase